MVKRIDNKVFAREFLYFAFTIVLTLIISGVRELYYINKSGNLEDLRVEYSEHIKTAHEYRKKNESQYSILKKIESATTQLQENEYSYKVYKTMKDLYSDFDISYNIFSRKLNNTDTVDIVYNLLVEDKILTKSHDEFSNKLKEKFNIMDLSDFYGNDFYQLLLKKVIQIN